MMMMVLDGEEIQIYIDGQKSHISVLNARSEDLETASL